MKDHGDFDHNKQSFRIVTELEQRYTEFPGLNLTWEVREAIVKHESEYDITFASDFNPELRGNLETQITNVADELAYTTHDLDDGLRSGMLTPQMLDGIALWVVMTGSVNWQGLKLEDITRHRMIRKLVDMEVSDLVLTTETHLRESGAESTEDIQSLEDNVMGFSEDMKNRNRELKDFLYTKLYRQHRVVRMQTKAEHIINDLFKAYCDEPAILPEHVQEYVNKWGLERVVCDYIAGMTDRYAVEEHQKLFNPLEKP
jgi:dGTPase